jgi:hypothetical protein
VIGFDSIPQDQKHKRYGVISGAILICYHHPVANRTEPKTAGQWIRYIVVAAIALYLVWWMLRVYVL